MPQRLSGTNQWQTATKRMVVCCGSFEANHGQARGPVQFLSRGRSYALFLTGDEAVLRLERASQNANRPALRDQMANVKKPGEEIANRKLETGNSDLATRYSSQGFFSLTSATLSASEPLLSDKKIRHLLKRKRVFFLGQRSHKLDNFTGRLHHAS